MRFEIGKQAAVIDDTLKGIITNIHGNTIELTDHMGMSYEFDKSELVVVEKSQHELSKYTDINHRLLQEKKNDQKSKPAIFTKEKNEVVFEVDLHIHQLVASTKNMDSYDILSFQLSTARRKLEYAISKRFSKVIFIHGVGEGVLKNELIYLLKKYPVDFYDASYQKYGLGATEVYIYQNRKS